MAKRHKKHDDSLALEVRVLLFIVGLVFMVSMLYGFLKENSELTVVELSLFGGLFFFGLVLFLTSVLGSNKLVDKMSAGFEADILGWVLLLISFPVAWAIRKARKK